MSECAPQSMHIVASETELPNSERVWGTGGWQQPEDREALDWLTLARFMGWGVNVSRQTPSGIEPGLAGRSNWIVIACNPDTLAEECVTQLATRMASERMLVVTRAAAAESKLARLAGAARKSARISGRSLSWIGPKSKRTWLCRKNLESGVLDLSADASVWATLEGNPIIAARQVGLGIIATIGFDPSSARDTDGAATSLLRHLLIFGSPAPVAWFDWEGTLVLRMDDAGGAQNVHSRTCFYPKLGEDEWATIAADLKRRDARMSIGYVSGWVDDGDEARGTLEIEGQKPRRVPGEVYPSPLVRYRDRNGYAPGTVHDYESEFRGIQLVRSTGRGEVELHGFTHMHPDRATWAKASDRYDGWPTTSWYRELGKAAQATIATLPPEKHPLALGIAALRRHFGVSPTALICPGEQFTNEILERALDLGLHLVGSYYLAIRDKDRFCWAQHVCAPYLDQPDPSWFDSGLPVVGYFHDFDLKQKGVQWLSQCLDKWQAAGARRVIDYRELAACIGRRLSLDEQAGELLLRVNSKDSPDLVRPIPVNLRAPKGALPSRVSVNLEGKLLSLETAAADDGDTHVILPCSRK